MAALTLNSIQLCTSVLGVILALAGPALAGDVSVKLDAGAGFSIKDSTGAIERLRIDEATGNISRNGTLFIHTTGISNTFVGVSAGNAAGISSAANSAFGFGALRANTGFLNSAVGYLALVSNDAGIQNSAVGAFALAANTSGIENSAVGNFALATNTTGTDNAAVGAYALYANTTGNLNSAFGRSALSYNTTGGSNTGIGYGALHSNTTGRYNTAVGSTALRLNTTGSYNTAVGFIALSHSTGDGNVAIGERAGDSLTTGSDNIYIAHDGVAAESGRIRIGSSPTHSATFVAGIRGATTGNANAIPVLIDSAGQLGTVSSSRSVKKDIRDMGDATSRLLELRPVTFRYREQRQMLPDGGAAPPEYGLIAEEVAEIFPDLVVYDDAGAPFTVKYHELAPMLLNEMKKERREHAQQMAALTARLARLEQRLSEAPR